MTASKALTITIVLSMLVVAVACGDEDSGVDRSPTPTQAPVDELPIPDPYEIYVADAEASGRTLLFASDNNTEFAWSPEGNELAIVTSGIESTKVRFIGLDGAVRAEVEFAGSSSGLDWSPDGRFVASTTYTGTKSRVIAISSDGSGHKSLFEAPDAGYLLVSGWLPSGEILVAKGEATLPPKLLAFDVDTGNSRAVADIDYYADSFGRPALSPDGRSLAVISRLSDKGCDTPVTGNAIAVIDLESGGVTQVSSGGHCGGGGIVWSPDGTQIAFSELGVPDTSSVFVADVTTQVERRLASGLNNVVAWLDDGTILAQQLVCIGCDGGGYPKMLALDSADGEVLEITGKAPSDVSATGKVATAEDGVQIVDLTGSPVRELAPQEPGWQFLGLGWSPDDAHVAYVRSHTTGPHIFEVNADGSGFGLAASPASPLAMLSADGTRIAYVDARDSTKDKSTAHLILADADGSNPTDVGVEGVISFSWSPDGGRLIFATASVEGGVSTLYLVNSDGGGLREIEASATISVDSLPGIWSPDGSKIAFAFGDLFVVEVETGKVTFLAQNPSKLIDRPSWSADSERLVFGRGIVGRNGSEIVITDADGSGSRTILSDDRNLKTSAVFSPDGEQIAFLTSGPDKGTKLAVVDSDGSGEQTIAEGVLLGPSISWSPNGDVIAAAIALEGKGGIFLVNPDGTGTRQLTQSGAFTDVEWLDDDTLRFSTYQGGL